MPKEQYKLNNISLWDTSVNVVYLNKKVYQGSDLYVHELICVMKDELVNFTFCVSTCIMLCIDMCLVKSWKMLIVEHFSFYSIILSNM